MTTIRTFAPETFYTERADTCIDETFPRTMQWYRGPLYFGSKLYHIQGVYKKGIPTLACHRAVYVTHTRLMPGSNIKLHMNGPNFNG